MESPPYRGSIARRQPFDGLTALGARLCSLLRPPAGSCSLLRDTTARAGPVPLADELDHVGKRRCADGAAGRCSACRHWRVTSLALGDDQTPRATPPTGSGMESPEWARYDQLIRRFGTKVVPPSRTGSGSAPATDLLPRGIAAHAATEVAAAIAGGRPGSTTSESSRLIESRRCDIPPFRG